MIDLLIFRGDSLDMANCLLLVCMPLFGTSFVEVNLNGHGDVAMLEKLWFER
jgi:hypothetical protein